MELTRKLARSDSERVGGSAERTTRTMLRGHCRIPEETKADSDGLGPGRVQSPYGPWRRCGDVDGVARVRASGGGGGVGLGARRDSEQTPGILVGRREGGAGCGGEGRRRGWGRGVGRGVGGEARDMRAS